MNVYKRGENKYSRIEVCRTCLSYVNVINERYCCGTDYLVKALNQPHIEGKEWDAFVAETTRLAAKIELKRTRQIIKEEKERTRQLKSQIKDVRKRNKKRVALGIEFREMIIKRDKKRCVDCGGKGKLHIHHKIAVEEGGTNDPDNLETLCDLCHAERHRGERIYNVMIKSLWQYEEIDGSLLN